MKVLNFGSLNIDHFYEVEHIVRPGETIPSGKYRLACGGKGLNQSVALAHAGAKVFHAGKVGRDGEALLACLRTAGVNTHYVEIAEDAPSGHAIIQVDKNGQNSIIIHGGANRAILKEDVSRVLGNFAPGDYLLLQNEVSCMAEIIDRAKKLGLTIFLNPAPMDEQVAGFPLDKVDFFIINEIEGRESERGNRSGRDHCSHAQAFSRRGGPADAGGAGRTLRRPANQPGGSGRKSACG